MTAEVWAWLGVLLIYVAALAWWVAIVRKWREPAWTEADLDVLDEAYDALVRAGAGEEAYPLLVTRNALGRWLGYEEDRHPRPWIERYLDGGSARGALGLVEGGVDPQTGEMEIEVEPAYGCHCIECTAKRKRARRN